jgi:rod shape determining protein RodA
VLLFGKEVNGARAWFAMGGFGMQPAEFAKFATALALRRYLSGSRPWRHALTRDQPR